MATKFAILTAGAALVFAATTATNAQSPPCGPREALATALEQGFGEQRLSHGVLDSGALLELWAAQDGSTWTLLTVRPDGIACVVATGNSWAMPTPRDVYFDGPPPPKRRNA
jgi:hypothetical protein